MIRRRSRWSRTRSSAFAASTLAELAWQKTRVAASHWSAWGALAGALLALIAFAPAAWLAGAVSSATGERVLLTEARGTVWSGSALPVLTGGPGSRDAAALPSRLAWNVDWRGLRFDVRTRQDCCLNDEIVLRLQPGFGRFAATLEPKPEWIGRWPASWLAGLGTPWNTLQLGGMLKLASPGLALESVQGRWRMSGAAELDVLAVSSRLSTLPTLGSYRVSVQGDAASGDAAQVSLTTLDGALRLSGSGTWSGGRMRFRGEARAAEGSEEALANLLNIIGRREGARAVISIGWS
jgi:general secretion pathway protein N